MKIRGYSVKHIELKIDNPKLDFAQTKEPARQKANKIYKILKRQHFLANIVGLTLIF